MDGTRRTKEAGVVLVRMLGLAMAAVVAFAAFPGHVSALDREALAQAQLIRVEVTANYRHAPGRKVAVAEATSVGVLESYTLITDWLEPWRVVPGDNGIYFAIGSQRVTGKHHARPVWWPAGAFLPRRMALELALRTLSETSVDLVIVSLPTAQPTWLVAERAELLATIDAPAALRQLAASPAVADPPLRGLVDVLTWPRLFRPLPMLPPPKDTMYAVRLPGP